MNFAVLVYDSVYAFYDPSIYQNIIDKYSEKSIKKVVKDKISNLNNELQEYY